MRRKIQASGHPWKVRDRATGIEMVLVMPGEFLMGSPESESGRNTDEGPQHRVRLTKAYYLGTTEVTQAQWLRMMGSVTGFFRDDSRPVDTSWDDLQEYLATANAKKATGVESLRLPTEAEWEYACRAGKTGPFGILGPIGFEVMNFCDGDVISSHVEGGKLIVVWETPPTPGCLMSTAPAGSLPPNAWGLHEMHGSLWELCADKYTLYASSASDTVVVDPFIRPVGDELRTLRGGSWYDSADDCRSAVRDAAGIHVRSNRIGFRVARSLKLSDE